MYAIRSYYGSEDVPLKYYVVGHDIDSVMSYSKDVLQALKSIDGTVETELSRNNFV